MDRDEEARRLEEYKHLKGWIKRLAGLDPPTGLLNRHGWIAMAARMLTRATREDQRFGLLLAEFDQFRQLTEEIGYEVGEEALQQVAEVLEGRVRPSDLLGRWQENQFILLLPAIEPEALWRAAERIREAVQAVPFTVGDRSLPVTVSVGWATWIPYRGDLRELDALISEADTKLTRAKQQGGNRVVF